MRRFNVASNNKTYLRLHVRHQICLPEFNHIWIVSTDLHGKSPIPYFKEIRIVGGRADTCELTGGHENNGRFPRLMERA